MSQLIRSSVVYKAVGLSECLVCYYRKRSAAGKELPHPLLHEYMEHEICPPSPRRVVRLVDQEWAHGWISRYKRATSRRSANDDQVDGTIVGGVYVGVELHAMYCCAVGIRRTMCPRSRRDASGEGYFCHLFGRSLDASSYGHSIGERLDECKREEGFNDHEWERAPRAEANHNEALSCCQCDL